MDVPTDRIFKGILPASAILKDSYWHLKTLEASEGLAWWLSTSVHHEKSFQT